MCGPGEVAQLGERRRAIPVARDDGRDADLAHDVVGSGHHRDGGDVGMGRQHALDLDRIHVVTAPYVHLLAPAHESQPATIVDPTEVAGAHEAVGGEGRTGLLGIAPVAGHDGGGAQADLADVVARDGFAVAVAK